MKCNTNMRKSTLTSLTVILVVLLGTFFIYAFSNQNDQNNQKTDAVVQQSDIADNDACEHHSCKCDHDKGHAELSQHEFKKECNGNCGENCKKHCKHHKTAESHGHDNDSTKHTHTE